MALRLPAEWENQDAILLAWPHEETDWHPVLEEVEPVFMRLVAEISRFERVVLATADSQALTRKLRDAAVDAAQLILHECPTNDTWARDFGPITVLDEGRPRLLDFVFNGWGLKFPACHDNQVTRRLHRAGAFDATPLQTSGMVLEGGSIESDGRGTLLTSSRCLLDANRNPHLSQRQIEDELSRLLGVRHFLWLQNGYLAGDDTDSHIDTLARLCPDDTILHVACNDPHDEHFAALNAMTEQLRAFRTPEGRPYRLIPLPWPEPRHDDTGQRLPATYANFLVINGAVLVPTYHDPSDALALSAVGQAFPGRAIVGIDCRPLILQHGSLHCVTMQLPQGVLP